jgi:hypothetical protein
MMLPDDHQSVEIESFEMPGGTGLVGKVGLRPVRGQKFPASLLLEGNKSLVEDYAVGTRFKVQAKLMKRTNGSQYLFTSWQWDVKTLGTPDQAA